MRAYITVFFMSISNKKLNDNYDENNQEIIYSFFNEHGTQSGKSFMNRILYILKWNNILYSIIYLFIFFFFWRF